MQFQSNKALCCDKIHRKNRYPRPDVSSLVEVGMTFQMTFRFATKQISNDRSTSSPAASTINDQTRKDLTMPRCSSVHNCAHQKAKTSRWAERIPPDGITCPFGNNGKGALLLVIHCLPGATATVENENRRKRQGYRYRFWYRSMCHVMITNDTLLNSRLRFPTGGWENFHFYG